MDPVTTSTLAASAIAALSPIIAKGLEELAKSTFKDAYAALKERLSRDPEGKKAVEKFETNPSAGAPELQKVLAEHLVTDAELMRLLAAALEKSGTAEPGSLVGKIEAEKVVFAEKIDTVNM